MPKRHVERRPIWLPVAIGLAALIVLGLLVALWSSNSGGSGLGHSHGKKSDFGGSHAGHSHGKKSGDSAPPAKTDPAPSMSPSPGATAAAEPRGGVAGGSITDRTVAWPTAAQWRRVVLLEDYNTRVVVGGTMMLGVVAGVIGSFTLLRKRALMGDALSHCTLPGIGLAFMVSVAAGGSGKALPVLLLGATVSGVAGLGAILLIRNLTRLKEDTALGIVLSVFFGAGVALLGIVQRTGEGHSAGLESFIYGKTASMVSADARLIAVAAGFVLATCALLFKEFKLLCFDAVDLDFVGSLDNPDIRPRGGIPWEAEDELPIGDIPGDAFEHHIGPTWFLNIYQTEDWIPKPGDGHDLHGARFEPNEWGALGRDPDHLFQINTDDDGLWGDKYNGGLDHTDGHGDGITENANVQKDVLDNLDDAWMDLIS